MQRSKEAWSQESQSTQSSICSLSLVGLGSLFAFLRLEWLGLRHNVQTDGVTLTCSQSYLHEFYSMASASQLADVLPGLLDQVKKGLTDAGTNTLLITTSARRAAGLAMPHFCPMSTATMSCDWTRHGHLARESVKTRSLASCRIMSRCWVHRQQSSDGITTDKACSISRSY